MPNNYYVNAGHITIQNFFQNPSGSQNQSYVGQGYPVPGMQADVPLPHHPNNIQESCNTSQVADLIRRGVDTSGLYVDMTPGTLSNHSSDKGRDIRFEVPFGFNEIVIHPNSHISLERGFPGDWSIAYRGISRSQFNCTRYCDGWAISLENGYTLFPQRTTATCQADLDYYWRRDGYKVRPHAHNYRVCSLIYLNSILTLDQLKSLD